MPRHATPSRVYRHALPRYAAYARCYYAVMRQLPLADCLLFLLRHAAHIRER